MEFLFDTLCFWFDMNQHSMRVHLIPHMTYLFEIWMRKHQLLCSLEVFVVCHLFPCLHRPPKFYENQWNFFSSRRLLYFIAYVDVLALLLLLLPLSLPLSLPLIFLCSSCFALFFPPKVTQRNWDVRSRRKNWKRCFSMIEDSDSWSHGV